MVNENFHTPECRKNLTLFGLDVGGAEGGGGRTKCPLKIFAKLHKNGSSQSDKTNSIT